MPRWRELYSLDADARRAEAKECLDVVDAWIARGKTVSVRSSEFLQTTHERFDKYDDKTLISTRELEWLRNLHDRCS